MGVRSNVAVPSGVGSSYSLESGQRPCRYLVQQGAYLQLTAQVAFLRSLLPSQSLEILITSLWGLSDSLGRGIFKAPYFRYFSALPFTGIETASLHVSRAQPIEMVFI